MATVVKEVSWGDEAFGLNVPPADETYCGVENEKSDCPFAGRKITKMIIRNN